MITKIIPGFFLMNILIAPIIYVMDEGWGIASFFIIFTCVMASAVVLGNDFLRTP